VGEIRRTIGIVLCGIGLGIPLALLYIISVGGVDNPTDAIALSIQIIENIGPWAFLIDAVIFIVLARLISRRINRQKERSDHEADD